MVFALESKNLDFAGVGCPCLNVAGNGSTFLCSTAFFSCFVRAMFAILTLQFRW